MNSKETLLIHLGIAIVWAFTPFVLVMMGFLNCQRLKALRPYMIVANFVVAALVTTPEILTQVIAAIPLQVCYEVTVFISRLRERQRNQA